MANHVNNEEYRLIHRPTDDRVAQLLRFAGVDSARERIEENLACDLERNTVLEEV